MEDFDAQQPQGGEINIQIDEETAEGTYVNLVTISHSPEEFIFDFIRSVPGTRQAKVKERVIVTPQHAKRLVAALQDNINQYEEMHGSIQQPGEQQGGGDGPRLQFGSGGEA